MTSDQLKYQYEAVCKKAAELSVTLNKLMCVNACIGFGENRVPEIYDFAISPHMDVATCKCYRNGHEVM